MRRSARFLLLAALCAWIVPTIAIAASDEDCRKFHAECREAKAAGFRDVGICNVERLECPRGGAERTEGAGKTPRRLPSPQPDEPSPRPPGTSIP